MKESKTVEGRNWQSLKASAEKLGITEKKVKELIDSFHFIVNKNETFIDEQSLDEYMIDGRVHRLEAAMKMYQAEHDIEQKRAAIEVEIEGLNPESAVDIDRKKELELQLADIPKGKHPIDPLYKQYKGWVHRRTLANHGLLFEAGTLVSPVFFLFWKNIMQPKSDTRLDKWIGTKKEYELERKAWEEKNLVK